MIDQIQLVNAVIKELGKQGVKDANPRQLNTVIASVNSIIKEFQSPTQPATAGMGLQAWLASDDVGQSSLYMASVLCAEMMSVSPSQLRNAPYAHPHDPDDLGRCIRFLQAVPEARDRLRDMEATSKIWKFYVANWGSLESLYSAGTKGESDFALKELYGIMQHFQDKYRE